MEMYNPHMDGVLYVGDLNLKKIKVASLLCFS